MPSVWSFRATLPRLHGVTRQLRANCRGAVSVWIACAVPVLLICVAMATDGGAWQHQRLQVQRDADIAATAAAMNYVQTYNKMLAALEAFNMAALNDRDITFPNTGKIFGSGPVWNARTNTLSGSGITVQVVSGVKVPGDVAFKVSVQSPGQHMFSISPQSVVVGATSMTELMDATTAAADGTVTNIGGLSKHKQGALDSTCVLALGGYTGQTNWSTLGSAITVDNGTAVYSTSCVFTSNTGMEKSGVSVVNLTSIYLAGDFTDTSAADSPVPNTFVASYPYLDPLASNADIKQDMAAVALASGGSDVTCTSTGGDSPVTSCVPATGVTCTTSLGDSGNTCTLQPGTYRSLTLSDNASVNLAPGAFVFTNSLKAGHGTSLSGSNVTIFLGSNATLALTPAKLSLSAPAASGATAPAAIAGVVLASQTGVAATLGGSDMLSITGIAYLPNAPLNYAAPFKFPIYPPSTTIQYPASSRVAASTCTVMIADTVNLTGNVILDTTGCSNTYQSFNWATTLPLPTQKPVKSVMVN